jgi:serine/threonine-protein kinase HipA
VSVLHVAPGAVRLAPVYDVVCTLAYAALEDVLPLRFAGQLAPAALTPADFTKGAREFGLAPARARGLVADVCDRLDAARCDALGWASAAAGPHSILDAMDRLVDEGTRLTRARLLGS